MKDMMEQISIYYESLNQQSGLMSNIGWVIPMIISIIIAVGTILLVNRNTNKQMNKQMELSYLPYVTIIESKHQDWLSINRGFSLQQQLIKGNMNSSESIRLALPVSIRFKLKNIGQGLAKNLDVLSISAEFCISEVWRSGINNSGTMSTYSIGSGDTFDLDIEYYPIYEMVDNELILDFDNKKYFIIVYTGINNRIYSIIFGLTLQKGNDEKVFLLYSYHNEGSYMYNIILKDRNIKIETLKMEYEKKQSYT